MAKKKRIIVKIGTNILTTEKGQLDLNNLRNLVTQICNIQSQKKTEFIVVTSGSITCGAEKLDIKPSTIPEKQATAAVGQLLLLQEYRTFFEQHGIQIAQILLTQHAFTEAVATKNITNTLETLLKKNVIPIINENDTVATDEIKFGDNDELSSKVAVLMKVDHLILLTDTDGLYTDNPKTNKKARLIHTVEDRSQKLMDLVNDSPDGRSRGGMKSKLQAALHTTEHGIDVTIANGRETHIIRDILGGKAIGTHIKPS